MSLPRALAWLGSVLLVAGLVPVLLPALGAGLAWLGGCTIAAVDSIPPCHVAGVEVTWYLRAVALLPWLMLMTLPLAMLGAALLALAGLIAAVRWARQRR